MFRRHRIALAALIVGGILGTINSAGLAQTALLGRQAEVESAAQGAEQDAERPEIETDRDAFTPATSTVGKSLTILESSYSFIDNRQRCRDEQLS